MRPCDRLPVNSWRHLHATCIGMSSASHFHEVDWAFEVAVLTVNAAFRGSWADSLHMIHRRHGIRCTFLNTVWRSASRGFRSGEPTDWHARPWVAGSNRSRALTPCESQVRPTLTEQALLRSQGGPLLLFPTSTLARLDSTQFRVLVSSPSSRNCRVWSSPGRLWHHRAA